MTAPSIVAGHTTAADTSNTTNHTINAPAHSAGNTIYIVCASDGNSDLLTAPTDFDTLYDNIPIETDALSKVAVFSVFYKTATGSEPGSYTVTSSVSERCGMVAFAVAGAGSIDASGADTRGSSATATLPAVTTTVADCLRISLVGTDVDTTPHGSASSLSKLAEAGATSSGTVSVYYKTLPSSGLSASETVSLNISEQWVTRTFALAPATVGETVTPGAAQAASSATSGAVILGSTVATTAPASAASAATAPAVILGSMTVTAPAAQATSAATVGAIILGSLAITAAAAQAATSALVGLVEMAGATRHLTLPRRKLRMSLRERSFAMTLPPRQRRG